MADSTDRGSGDLSQNRLKQELTNWRQLLVTVHSVLVWRSDIYPMALSAAVSLIFSLIWYLDASVLTTLSVIGIVSAVIDYSLPIINQYFFDSSKWSASDESQFDSICEELHTCWTTIKKAYGDCLSAKASNPKIYYAVLLVTLLALSWIGNVVHNLFLTYLLVLFVVMFPGLKQRGFVDKYVSLAMSYISKPKKN